MKKIETNKLPLVVICGRTNVGKSTLFNCLIENKQALVSDISGTTRDSNLGIVEWAKSAFQLVDTAGLLDAVYLTRKKIVLDDDDIDSKTQRQAKKYLDEAEVLIFLVDTKAGLMPEDIILAKTINKVEKYRKKTILVANKVDSFHLSPETAQFNKLNLGEPIPVSAASGSQTGDLLDKIISILKKSKKEIRPYAAPEENESLINVCLIGKPNVGKSSFLNSILGYERVIVSPIAHTTREPQHTDIIYQDNKIRLIDTAGISKKGQKTKGLEKPGIIKSLKSLDKADIALLVVDISEPITHQDLKLVEEIIERQISFIIIANKWDAVEDRDTKKWSEYLYDKMPFATWAPLQFISAKTGEKVQKVMDIILNVYAGRSMQISDSQAEKFMKRVIKIHKPAKGKGLKAPRIYEFRQTKNNPPTFIIRIGPDDNLHFSYVRFMENRLRERFGFLGTPIKMVVTKNKKSHTTYSN
ncbi:MAG: ribosome biogenesis GTPase Der [Patescibacteria group bacterium]|jgi:GTP-binding protein|nr:ribosome biogenesis GTPase Der [Patescibacteria group bacterium]MDD3777782.1 ribosome biogenesis GTPase Der [Patescibacteria group bacterium]MDD3939448.1 ribosome biogenesis GTPase Der [Patescibacteria group bacterium]MDD4443529.1 ribosome biogenesis GTPase Der [Patescibacteria group bacterium]NCU39485.1 ribosome biogenesis GTPase Der [Candidatus Falkowbacteria bacterium]